MNDPVTLKCLRSNMKIKPYVMAEGGWDRAWKLYIYSLKHFCVELIPKTQMLQIVFLYYFLNTIFVSIKSYVPSEPWRNPFNHRLYEHGIWYLSNAIYQLGLELATCSITSAFCLHYVCNGCLLHCFNSTLLSAALPNWRFTFGAFIRHSWLTNWNAVASPAQKKWGSETFFFVGEQ